MNKSQDPNDSDHVLRRLCELARAAFTEDLTAREEAGRTRLEAAVLARPRSRRLLAVAFGLATATAAVLPIALMWNHKTAPSLGFRIVDEAGVLQATRDLASAGRIEFSDGSRVTVAAQARASVTAIEARGASIQLEYGRLTARVVHLPQARWSIAAGPYQVQVTGTTFEMSWAPDARALEIWLRQGSVQVFGPNTGQGLAVVAGQHLLASAANGQIVLDAMSPATISLPPLVGAAAQAPTVDLGQVSSPVSEPPFERPSMGSPSSPRAPRSSATPRSSSPAPSLSWPQSLARGEFQRILDDAEQRGIGDVLAGATSADLAALADAARYNRRNDLARRTLLAERERFPRTLAGREAAFFLGTLDESRADRAAQTSALDWYGRYLAENPAGNYGGQALGRRLVLFDSLQDRAAARAAAASYLAKFPAGPYAVKAQHIVESGQ
jgi:FecR protein